MSSTYEYSQVVRELRQSFRAGKLLSYESRYDALRQIFKLVVENEESFIQAIYKDQKKPRYSLQLIDILHLKEEIEATLRALQEFMKPVEVPSNAPNKMNKLQIRRDPFGLVLVISPWNYPLMLSLKPVASALAAGNCVILKPSELSEHTAKLLEELCPKYISQDVLRVINGGIDETTALLKERFDHIFYCGGTRVGRIVYQAASKHLTPVTLELGGKCPAIVDETCDYDITAKRILWSRFINAGQACISADYALCTSQDVHDKLVTKLCETIQAFYGGNPKESTSFGRIINRGHFDRIRSLVDVSKCVVGGEFDPDDLYISPTVMANVTSDDMIMSEETFGPVLAVLALKGGIEEAIDFVNDREKPLALYVFTNDERTAEKVLTRTSSGGACVNECINQAIVSTLPFGGVGESGMGALNGVYSLETFSHRKSCVLANSFDEINKIVKYPPYGSMDEDEVLRAMYTDIDKKFNEKV